MILRRPPNDTPARDVLSYFDTLLFESPVPPGLQATNGKGSFEVGGLRILRY